MLIGNSILTEHVRLDPRFAGKPVTEADAALVALEMKGQHALEAIRYGNALLKEKSGVLQLFYNASGTRLWLISTKSWNDQKKKAPDVQKYPPDYYIDNGQWSLFTIGELSDHPQHFEISYAIGSRMSRFTVRSNFRSIEATIAHSEGPGGTASGLFASVASHVHAVSVIGATTGSSHCIATVETTVLEKSLCPFGTAPSATGKK